MAKLEQLLRGVKVVQAKKGNGSRTRLPITPPITLPITPEKFAIATPDATSEGLIPHDDFLVTYSMSYSELGIAHLYIEVATNGDVTDSLYSALKVQEYCDSKWTMLCSYLKIPSNTCPNDPVARLEYITKGTNNSSF